MIRDMQNNVNQAIKLKKEIDKAIKPENNICQHEDKIFDMEIIQKLSL
jgi:hypothetical protein